MERGSCYWCNKTIGCTCQSEIEYDFKREQDKLEKIGDTFRLTFRPAEDALLTDFKIRMKHIPALIKELQRIINDPKTR